MFAISFSNCERVKMNDCMYNVKIVAPVTVVNKLEKFSDDRPYSLMKVSENTLPNTLKPPNKADNPIMKFKRMKSFSLFRRKSDNRPNIKSDAPNVLDI